LFDENDDEVLLPSPAMSEAEVEDVLTLAEQMQVSATLDSIIKEIIENQEEIDYYEEALDEDPTDEQARTSIGVLNSVRANLLQEAQQMQADAQAERDVAIAAIANSPPAVQATVRKIVRQFERRALRASTEALRQPQAGRPLHSTRTPATRPRP
jgi:hypothetical protein